MKLRYKIGGSALILIGLMVVLLAVALSHNTECGPAPSAPADGPLMKAVTYRCYGPPEVLEYGDVAKPSVANNEVLVKVHAAGVNPYDWHFIRGSPYVMRLMSGIGAPRETRLGVDFAGTVEAVGPEVTRFKPGDAVFGAATGAFGEYVSVREDRSLAHKPANVSFEQGASLGIAAITALQGLRDAGRLQSGQKVLINGASGGVGTFAVQIAKAYGAEVTGVCSTRNLQMVRSLGADHVIDYKSADFTTLGKRYDLILDMVGNHSLLKLRHAMQPEGTLVMVGSISKGNWIGPLAKPLSAMVFSPFLDQEIISFLAHLEREDLVVLGDMMRDGTVTPVIDRRFPLSEVPDAIRYSEAGRARGKIIISTL